MRNIKPIHLILERSKEEQQRIKERFYKHINKIQEDECWDWLACKNGNGYGLFYIHRIGRAYSHRVSYTLHLGVIPDQMLVCHSCDNTSCVNPKHLFLGNEITNAKDMVKKGRCASTGERSWKTKLTNEDVVTIRSKFSSGQYTYKQLAEQYGVGQNSICRIVKRKRWSHI